MFVSESKLGLGDERAFSHKLDPLRTPADRLRTAAVCIAPTKLPQALALRQQGCALKIVADSVACMQAIGAFGREHGEAFEVWIKIDLDGHRSGIAPDDDLLLTVAVTISDGGMHLAGLIAHAGSSRDYETHEELVCIAEQERADCVRAAQRIRATGLRRDVVSIGSTPTALAAEHLERVTEVRAGVVRGLDDAPLAVHHSADGIMLSNHGERQFGSTSAPLEILPPVVDAVGSRTERVIDSGVRRGSDALKAVALGARHSAGARSIVWARFAGCSRGS